MSDSSLFRIRYRTTPLASVMTGVSMQGAVCSGSGTLSIAPRTFPVPDGERLAHALDDGIAILVLDRKVVLPSDLR